MVSVEAVRLVSKPETRYKHKNQADSQMLTWFQSVREWDEIVF